VILGTFPSNPHTRADEVSADGEIIAGTSWDATPSVTGPTWIWDQAHGMRDLKQVLASMGASIPAERTLTSVDGMSYDGGVLAGAWRSNQQGGWVAILGAPCYADCNGDGSLTVGDFGCFQTKFVAGCP
jgi:uncharacterized membrane protein